MTDKGEITELLGFPVTTGDFFPEHKGSAIVALGSESFRLKVRMGEDGILHAELADGYDDAAKARFHAALIEMQNNAERYP